MSPPLRLSGRFITLRDFRPADEAALRALGDDEAMFEFMKGRIDSSWVARVLPEFLREPELGASRRSFSLAVIGEDGGFIGLAMIGELTDDRQAEFGWYLGSDDWGRGYATDATVLLLTFGFGELGLVRMYATADPENAASIRVLTKAGLRNEGPTGPVATWRGMRPRLLFSIDLDTWLSQAGKEASTEP
ncbi:MAG TPA: GNAT family N-acetyltransferase [Acidimicrobiales bacterium]|jgi:RimJ/RimL family protein N-acetyltransferase|nr:GNAT family N-acetyltransferase [Acidimicrobiales bacterium]